MSYREYVTRKLTELSVARGLSVQEVAFVNSIFARISNEHNEGKSLSDTVASLKADRLVNQFITRGTVPQAKVMDYGKKWTADVRVSEIQLQNYGKTFYGKPIVMRIPDEGVVLLIGPNGAGKTTLISYAPRFTMYGGPEKSLLHDRAKKEGKRAWAQVNLRIGDVKLSIRREIERGRMQSPEVLVNGEKKGPNSQRIIERLIPQELATLIWGVESPHQLTEKVKLSRLAEDLALLPELEVATRVCKTLCDDITDEIKKISEKKEGIQKSTEEIDGLQDELEDLKAEFTKKDEMIKKIEEQIDKKREECEDLALKEQEIKKIQERYDGLKKEKESYERTIYDLEEEIYKLYDLLPFALVVREIGAEEINRRLQETSVDFLLGKVTGKREDREETLINGNCKICTRGIDDGISPVVKEQVQSLSEEAAKIKQIGYQYEMIDGEKFIATLDESQEKVYRIKELQNKINWITTELTDLEELLSKVPDVGKEVARLEGEIGQLEDQKCQLVEEREDMRKKVEDIRQLIKRKEDIMKLRLEEETKRGETAHKELQLLIQCRGIYDELRSELKQSTLQKLEEEASRYFRAMTNSPEVYEGVRIDITGTGDAIKLRTKPTRHLEAITRDGMSEGEKEVASLAVLLACKKEACKSSLVLGFPAIHALDGDHHEKILRLLASEEHGFKQMILMVTPEQADYIKNGRYFSVVREYSLVREAGDPTLYTLR